MLQNTFCHVPGIGPGTERRLWDGGFRSWEMIAGGGRLPLSRARAEKVQRHVATSAAQLERGDARYFAGRLAAAEHWRLFPEFRDSVAYIDIETTGLGGCSDVITTIALYDGEQIRHYVRGENLWEFGRDVAAYRLLVTYNGKCFDLPFIRAHLGIPMEQAHIDLRYVLAGLGYRGGLKGCEKSLGLDRGELDGVDGYDAVLLWELYRASGDRRALETLLAYNMLDVVNLAALMPLAYNLKLRETPFADTHRLEIPARPEIPFQPDPAVIRRIRTRT